MERKLLVKLSLIIDDNKFNQIIIEKIAYVFRGVGV
jgi:hypothetical protein